MNEEKHLVDVVGVKIELVELLIFIATINYMVVAEFV